MAKRVFALALGLLLAVQPFVVAAVEVSKEVVADEEAEESLELLNLEEDVEAAPVIANMADSLPAKSAILLEQSTGNVLFEQNADEQLPPASVTKVMTLLLVMEALESGKISLDDMIVCSEYANSMGGSQIWLKVGEQMSVNDLLKAVCIASANDASVLLGEHVAGSNDAFVQRMNERAKELGMDSTVFRNATGLDEEGHVTTSRDIAMMSRELMKHPRIAEYSTVWMDSLRGGATELVNTNKLVRFYNGCTGLKTGTTNGAGSCLSATASRDGLSLVAVVMGCDTSDDRFASARGLLDFGFANYQSVEPPAIDDQLAPVPVLRGTMPYVDVIYDPPGTFVIEKGNEEAMIQEVTLTEDVEAPVHTGQVLGKVEVVVNGEVVGTYNLKAASEVERLTLGKAFLKLLRTMLRLCSDFDALPEPEPPTTEEETGESESAAENDNGTTEATEATEATECPCGIETCYCEEIGDVCGCTK